MNRNLTRWKIQHMIKKKMIINYIQIKNISCSWYSMPRLNYFLCELFFITINKKSVSVCSSLFTFYGKWFPCKKARKILYPFCKKKRLKVHGNSCIKAKKYLYLIDTVLCAHRQRDTCIYRDKRKRLLYDGVWTTTNDHNCGAYWYVFSQDCIVTCN